MELIPKTVLVTVPVNIPELRGRHSTTPPHGVVTSFRSPTQTLEEVDKARNLIDPLMSRALFMRLSVHSVALAINEHYSNVKSRAEDITNGYGNTTGTP